MTVLRHCYSMVALTCPPSSSEYSLNTLCLTNVKELMASKKQNGIRDTRML